MGKISRKAQKRLDARRKGCEEARAIAAKRTGNSYTVQKALRTPGSKKK